MQKEKKRKKERKKEQPNQKRNPPMITSAKNYIKQTNKQNKMDRQNTGKMVQVKLYRQNHTEKHTHTD